MDKNRNDQRPSLILIPVIIMVAIAGILIAVRNMRAAPAGSQPFNLPGEIVSGSFDPTRTKSDEEWRLLLTPEQYRILRQAGTELPYTGNLNDEKRAGSYTSVGCGIPLFRSEQKYDSGTGWPSFWAPVSDDAVVLRRERTFGDDRVEVLDRCGNHLGHVFDDGPPPTGKRYCMNSAALEFIPDEQ